MLNLWIGLCQGCSGLPQDIFLLGFRPICIERPFRNHESDLVHPELVIASADCGHAVSFEWKSGRNLVDDQLRRYQGIAPADLRQAYIRPEESITHEVIVIGKEAYSETLLLGLAAGPYEFALLVVTDEGLTLIANDFAKAELSALFKPTYKLNWDYLPTEFIRIVGDSPDWEIAEAIIPAMLVRVLKGQPRFTVNDLCRDVSEFWNILGDPGRAEAEGRVRDVLRLGIDGQLGGFVVLNNQTVLPNTALRSADAKKRSEAQRGLRSAHARFIDALREGRQQMALFPASDLE